ncbi:hypothetical protein BC629DRAFT_186791 [Irpex lacteus]|nr:hypothetical protein BC629DRAFT_186791 [Irpex lacteus]
MNVMAASVVYSTHPYQHIVIDQMERKLIATSPIPINIFWVNHMGVNTQIKNCPTWLHSRSYMSLTGKTMTGVCVAYQSNSGPLASLGSHGDLWVMPQAMFIKTASGSWTPWNRKVKYPCPFDPSRRLAWTSNAHFKYIADDTARKEVRKWRNQGVPLHSIPEHVREESSHMRTTLSKSCKDLTEHDHVLLLNAYLDNLRRQSGELEGNGREEYDTPGSTQNHALLATQQTLLGQAHAVHSGSAKRGSSSSSPVIYGLNTQETGDDSNPLVDLSFQRTCTELECQSCDCDSVNFASDGSEDEVEFMLDVPCNRTSVTQSVKSAGPASPSLTMNLDVETQDDIEVDDNLETSWRQLKEHTSILRRLADTLDTESELQDRNWLDRISPDLRDVALASRKILSRHHSSS